MTGSTDDDVGVLPALRLPLLAALEFRLEVGFESLLRLRLFVVFVDGLTGSDATLLTGEGPPDEHETGSISGGDGFGVLSDDD